LAPSQLSLARRIWPLFVALAAILVGSFVGWHYFFATKAADAAPDPKTTASKGGGSGPIPVTVARAQKADFPVYLNGLGTVQPYYTVTVRSRVDGQIIKVAFKQGRMVKEGDILVEIDPRPYQAALDQVLAKKAQDEANLKYAKLNLERLCQLSPEGLCLQAAGRHAASDCRSVGRPDQGRSGSGRKRANADSATRPSRPRCREERVSAWSTRATSCMALIRTAS
jgi:multidrug efflux pump subunit AcrA (membrane-fusion protein)